MRFLIRNREADVWGGQSWPRAGFPAGSAARSAAGLAESESAGWIARPTRFFESAPRFLGMHGLPVAMLAAGADVVFELVAEFRDVGLDGPGSGVGEDADGFSFHV